MQTQSNSSAAVFEEGARESLATSEALLRCDNLRKSFRSGAQEIVPIDGLNFSILRGEMVAIVGPSGTGKSTLLHILAALDTPTSGTVYFGGNSLRSFSEAELAEYRSHDPAEPASNGKAARESALNGSSWQAFYSFRDESAGIGWQLRLRDLTQKSEWEQWKILDSPAIPVPTRD